MIAIRCYEISLGDTIGKANADDISALLDAVLAKTTAETIAGHFHDTDNNALGNVDASLAYGIKTFDAAIAGLGGCPFAPGAPGNLGTQKLLKYLMGKNYETGIDATALDAVASFVRETIKSKTKSIV